MPQISAQDYCVRMSHEGKSGAFWRDCIAELFANFFFVAAVLVLAQDGNIPSDPQAMTVKLILGSTFVHFALGYGLGDYGGAHMNNAITFACLIRSEISLLRAVLYWVMQGLGSVAAAFFVFAITPSAQRGMPANTVMDPELMWWQALVIELWITACVCMAFLARFNIDRKGYVIMSTLPVSVAFGAGIGVAAKSTGASMNSMRSLAPVVVSSVMMNDQTFWAGHWIYWAGPMCGGLVAAILYWIFDSVDAGSPNSTSPYMVQSGTWSYNTNQRSQIAGVKAPGQDVNIISNGMPTKANLSAIPGASNGLVQAYSNGGNGTGIYASNFMR